MSWKIAQSTLGFAVVNGLGPLTEDLMQWMAVTNVGAVARTLLDVAVALNEGVSCRATLEALRGF